MDEEVLSKELPPGPALPDGVAVVLPDVRLEPGDPGFKGDLAAAVVTHVVSVKASADDEWRQAYGSGSNVRMLNAVERADNKMYDKFGIDMSISLYDPWLSSAPSPRTCSSMISELVSDEALEGNDIVLAYSKTTPESGCAYLGGRYAVIMQGGEAYQWKVTQHEVSHIFNAPDRYFQYAGDNPYHTDDVMEDPYANFDFWCVDAASGNDNGIVAFSAGRFD